MDILVDTYYNGLLGKWRCPFPTYSPTRLERAVMEFIEENMAKPKRPPLAWDSRKDKSIKFPWGLYSQGKLIKDIVAYNVEEQWYIYANSFGSINRVEGYSFCVKRLG